MVGYKVWPKLGYNGDLSPYQKNQLPQSLQGSETLHELYATQEGRDWWAEHGESTNVQFDLSHGSDSREILDAYQISKGMPPIDPMGKHQYRRTLDPSKENVHDGEIEPTRKNHA